MIYHRRKTQVERACILSLDYKVALLDKLEDKYRGIMKRAYYMHSF